MEAVFVPSARGPLFAWLHSPERTRDRAACAVICNPFGQEFVLSHRSIQALARELARAGIWAIRFDWSGSGDSAGESNEVSLAAWREDLRLVIDAAVERTGPAAVALIGLRVGGGLALENAHRAERVKALILWDPVLDGRAYRDHLERTHHDRPRAGGTAPGIEEGAPLTEVAGYPLPERFQRELEAFDLTRETPRQALLVVQTFEDAERNRCIEQWRSRGAACEVRLALDQWAWNEEGERTLVPLKLLREMVGWLDGRL